MTASDLTLIDNFRSQLDHGLNAYSLQQHEEKGHGASACAMCALDKLASDLLRLRAELSGEVWYEFCRGLFQEKVNLALEHSRYGSLLRTWEQTLPSAEGRRKANNFFDAEIREAIRMTPRARILSLGETPLKADHFKPQYRADFHLDLTIAETLAKSTAAERFDFIYSADWLNHSKDSAAVEWLDAAAQLLNKSGRVLCSNLVPGGSDAAYLEARWNIWPVYRNEEDLAHLASQLTANSLRGHTVFRGDAGPMAFLEIQAA